MILWRFGKWFWK